MYLYMCEIYICIYAFVYTALNLVVVKPFTRDWDLTPHAGTQTQLKPYFGP